MTDRIEQIRSMLQRDPADVFLHYSLAMEYAAGGRVDEAVAEFGRCFELDADYLPAYVEAGKCLRSTGRLEEARRVFTRGMKLASSLGESHMREFIRQQIDALPRPL